MLQLVVKVFNWAKSMLGVVIWMAMIMMAYLARPKSAIFTMWLSPTKTFRAARSLEWLAMMIRINHTF